jgi:hypothetical protein
MAIKYNELKLAPMWTFWYMIISPVVLLILYGIVDYDGKSGSPFPPPDKEFRQRLISAAMLIIPIVAFSIWGIKQRIHEKKNPPLTYEEYKAQIIDDYITGKRK